jgi:hypothetical protein
MTRQEETDAPHCQRRQVAAGSERRRTLSYSAALGMLAVAAAFQAINWMTVSFAQFID